jgi:hypothetical protein
MASTKRTMPSPEVRLAHYEALVATIPGLERKGATMPYTSRNGHMFSFITKEGALALRLPKDAREAFMATHGTGPVVQHGAVMKDYVEVPAALLARTAALAPYFLASYEHVGALEPKPTAAKTTAAKKTAAKKTSAKKTSAKKR